MVGHPGKRQVMESMEEGQGAGEEEDGAGEGCVLQLTASLTP